MKKCFYMTAFILGIMTLAACTADETFDKNGANVPRDVVSTIKAMFGNNQSLSVGQSDDASLSTVTPRTAKNKTSRAGSTQVTEFTWLGSAATLQAGTASKLTNEVFMKDFPNNQDNLKADHPNLKELSFDFLYVSNGEPIEVWPLYSHALYIDDIGIYYYDQDDNMHEEPPFWSMADDGWLAKGSKVQNDGTYWKPKNNRYANEDVDTYNTTGTGYKFQLPKGWKWGFYIQNDQNGKKYSQATLHAKDSKGNLQKQVVTYQYGDYNIIGFEDIFYSGADKDYNDIALLVSPKQVVTPTGQVTVRWITEDGKELAPNEYSGEMASGATYTGEAKEFEGYALVDPTHTKETKVINEYDIDNVITFVYKEVPIPTTYTVNYYCKDCDGGNVLLDTKTYNGNVADNVYATEQMKQFEGHGFEAYDKESITLVKDAAANVINLYYVHTETSYIVKYLEEGTNTELIDPTVVNNAKIGETAKVNEAAIEGYTCTTPGEQSKTLVKDPNSNVFIYYYKKDLTEYTVKYLEEGTNAELKAPTVVTGKNIGETVKVNEATIEGYDCTNPGEQSKTLVKDPESNVFIYYYKKPVIDPIIPEPEPEPEPEPIVPEPVVPTGDSDIIIVLDALSQQLICASDDFCIKYNQYEMEYAYADGTSGSNLVDLKLEQGKPITITIPNIGDWANSDKVYWLDLGNGLERAVFDLRLYNCRDAQGNPISAEQLTQALNLNYIKKPAGYNVQIDCLTDTNKYGDSDAHVSILVDRIKQ